MKSKLAALTFGAAFGVVLAWARLSDPDVIRSMLTLREPDVFLLMGSAIGVAALGVRLLRGGEAKALLSGEPVGWDIVKIERRHIAGSVVFGAGWALAGTCPGPVAVMIGEGHLAGGAVALGLLAGVVLEPVLGRREPKTQGFGQPEGAAGL